MNTARTLSPSDLDAHRSSGEVTIAGRVLASSGLDVVLADAFAHVEVALDASSDLEEGDLAIVAGTPLEGRLSAARVVQRIAPVRPPVLADEPAELPRSETERFTHQGVGHALVARSVAIGATRAFFGRQRFLEVETPLLVPSPGLDLHLDAFEVEGGMPGRKGAPAYLITSPEYQMKRMLVGGIPRCFQIARCFRRGEIGDRHNPEFTMLEWYRAFAAIEEVMADTEELVRFVARELTGAEAVEIEGVRVDLAGPFERIPVASAFERFAGVSAAEAMELANRDEERFFRLFVDAVEPGLARLEKPVFLVDYPAEQASLARLSPGNPRVCERFELCIGGVELCNGFGELTDPEEQRERLERDQRERARAGKPVYPIDERFVQALEEGMPPSAGNALGLDRLIALCIGAERIGTVQAFPVEWV